MQFLTTQTENQLKRLWRKILENVGDGGCYGWDWVTLKICYPHSYSVLREISEEFKRRNNK